MIIIRKFMAEDIEKWMAGQGVDLSWRQQGYLEALYVVKSSNVKFPVGTLVMSARRVPRAVRVDKPRTVLDLSAKNDIITEYSVTEEIYAHYGKVYIHSSGQKFSRMLLDSCMSVQETEGKCEIFFHNLPAPVAVEETGPAGDKKYWIHRAFYNTIEQHLQKHHGIADGK